MQSALPSDLIVICGGSGSGKSTLARALQEAFLPQVWLHFSVDSVFYCLPQSIIEMANRRNDWSLIEPKSITGGAFACLRALLAGGHKVVFDCVVSTDVGARNLLLALEDFPAVFVGLTCSWEETRRRTLARGDRTVEEAEYGFKSGVRHLALDHTIDTTALSVQRATEILIEGLRKQRECTAWRTNIARYSIE
jgi:chloramphenicol 3-O phosphotransferase